ncbi:CopD family protein [Acuticoccus kandeliae]|uniref:CopD family protein n=1 Tax=Acuticoccus kandeliae TaxID=2073160 RepID=UPI000D3E8DA5|nr:CopD family protein [Acuticoccus kandeliae]
MIPALSGFIPLLKAIHIAALVTWCAGLLALPLMLARHDPAITQADYTRVRRFSHFTYVLAVTPTAVIAVASGTALIFLRAVFEPWLYAKLVFVALLVLVHAWVGHTLVAVAETAGTHRPPNPLWPTAIAITPMLAILFLVLAKPDLSWIVFPDWLTEPLGRQLPVDVPIR